MPREVIQPEGIWDARDAKGHSAGTGLQNGNGRFAQVVKIGDTVYVAGQTPVDAHGQLVGKGDIEVTGEEGMKDVAAIYAICESSLAGRPVRMSEIENCETYAYQAEIDATLGIE